MAALFRYRDAELYSHHSLDERPEQSHFPMHTHEWMEIFYFVSGKGRYWVEGTEYPLQPHDILIMRAAESHTLVIAEDEPYERIAFHFSPTLLTEFDPEGKLLRPFLNRPLGQRNRYAAEKGGAERLRMAFLEFSFENVPDVRLNLLARLLLFLTTLRSIYEQEMPLRLPSHMPQNRIVAYVNEHLFEGELSVQTVAKRFYRSPSQIARSFQQATGASLWRYVTIKRLMAARAMIQRGEKATEACAVCGFSDYSTFYRAYCSRFGHSPKEDAFR